MGNDSFGRNSYIYFGMLCILDHRPSGHPEHHMVQKSKERKEQEIRSSRHHIHYCYRWKSHESAAIYQNDR